MGVQCQFFLTAFIVSFGLTSVHNQKIDQAITNNVNDEIEIRENFQNLFNSIAERNIKHGRNYQKLEEEVARKRQVFDTMKEELYVAQNRNAYRKRNFYKNSNFVMTKREAKEDDNATAAAQSEYPFETKREKVEELFKDIHGDLSKIDSLKWELAENLTEGRLEKVCREVATAISPTNKTTYIPPTENKPQQRVIKEAPILFTASRYITYTRLINCTFEEMQFFLAPSDVEEDTNHVFCLTWEMNHIYCFRSGPHEISH